MKIVSTILVFVCMQFSTSAQNALLNIPDSGKAISSFIPKEFDIIDSAHGDLNKDGIKDVVIALKRADEDSIMDIEPKRILIVLLKNKHGYKVVGKSFDALMCRVCGGIHGDPFDEITITKGVLKISHYGGSAWKWVEVRKFRYQTNGIYLIGSTSDYYWSIQSCNGNEIGDAGRIYRDVNFVTGDEEIIERTEECKLIKQVKQKIKRKPLVKMEDFNFEEKY